VRHSRNHNHDRGQPRLGDQNQPPQASHRLHYDSGSRLPSSGPSCVTTL
jgi:hypothetical protein